MVGFNRRFVDWQQEHLQYTFTEERQGQYNIILTGAAFVSRANIESYWSQRYKRGRELVETFWNCEDLLMNAVAPDPPIFVRGEKEYQVVGLPGAMSGKSDHVSKRTQCLNSFREWYGSDWLSREQNTTVIV